MQMHGGFRVRSNGQPVVQSKATAARNGVQDTGGINETPGEVAAPDQSGSSSPIPSISLPKGGGAIRGIGEKFAANPVTGTGSLSAPIVTTPGRSGFGPQLSLSYDSGSGNGPFGFGWSLSLPSITRKTDKGLPRYQDAGGSDVFILSGAEDLVPILVNQEEEWQREQQPDRTLLDGSTFTIHCYRPRIEGLFACIESWTNNQTGDVHWQSISGDNITTIYGKTGNARIADPTDKSRVFSWLICESYDDKGNAIIYEYKEEGSASVDTSQAHEKNRSDPGDLTRSANRYLKRIRYGNRTPRQPGEDRSERTDWMFEVVFDYGEHDTASPTPQEVRPWSVRQDTFSTYRAGFEVRTYRLCERVLMFHHFPDELGTDDYLISSTEFTYDKSSIASFITEITQSGYVRNNGGTYLKKSLPPLEFEYSKATIQEEIKEIDAESIENLPIGLDGMSYRWVDLDGEGLSGILTEQADAWFYKPNKGGGEFGQLQLLAEKPSLADLNSGRQQLMDLAGDGQLDLVELSGPVPGFYEHTQDRHWKRFTPFASLPNLDFNDPNLKFLDLTGDGHADILITEDGVFTWYLSLAEEGFSLGEMVRQALDEETGPRLVFADGTQSIYLADLSGDGLTDLVRIRNGEVCYWPNLGYGRFGTKVTMDDAPWFDYPDQFNQQRIRLADIDGSGTTDIIYLGSNGVQIYLNQSGNRWSELRTLTQFPHVDNFTSVMVADLLGNGTACIVWSSPLPGNSQQQMRYIDLMGGQKPHLLISSKNNMGAQTRVHYAASTKFYLDDLKAGKPWITRIPFPVHVVERVETYDHISRNRFVTRYAYHHGYFDGIEREFRGFGMVEQWDTEEIGTDSFEMSEEDTNWEEVSFAPPVLTRTWFHTGAFLEGDLISKQFEDEYYREGDPSLGIGELDPGQFSAMLLDDTVLPEDLTVEGTREACRTLKGGILRQEVYALDRRPDGRLSEESDRPYTVSERNYTIKQLQPRGDNKHAVFFVHPLETIDFHYERKLVDVGVKKLADPRVSHQMTLKVDDYGNVERSVAIGYPRRLVPDRLPEQTETHITLTVNRFINSPELPIKFPDRYSPEDLDWYRVGVPSETQTYEIVKPPEPVVTDTSVALFKFEDIRTLTEGMFGLDRDEPDPSKTLLYEKWNWRKAPPGDTKLRLIEHVRTLYRKDDLTGFLPLGQLDSLALPYESYKLALTPGLVTQVFDGKVSDPTITNEGRYVHSEGDSNWWIPSGQVFYSTNKNDTPSQELAFAQQHFFLPNRFQDPFDQVTTISYDNYDLLMLESEDPLHNKVTAGERDEYDVITNKNDYRVLQPTLITDPNRAVSEALFDGPGMVVATAIHKGDVGDSLQGVQADLTQQQIDDFFTDPGGQAVTRLGPATTRIIYDMDRYYQTGNPDRPPFAATIARETHVSDPVPADGLKVQISFSYSDGFGREIQTKIQAEPGAVVDGGPIVDPRWVGTGWTIFNNKGKPVRQYEPFFDDTYDFRYGKEVGVSPILFYDPVERVVATLHPNNTYEKVVFDPWHQESYDVNDTLTSDPRTDTDISGYVGKYFTSQPGDWKTWLQQRGVDPFNPPQDMPGLDPEKKAAVRTLVHANTPTIAFSDSLGQTFLTVAHNKFERRTNGNTAIIEEKYNTQVVFDIEGNQREVIDARDRIVMQYDYDMLSSPIHHASMEAGERWMLNNVAGNPIRTWDSRGFQRRMTYDALQRPVGLFVTDTNGAEILAEKTEYGESMPDPETTNHRSKPWKVSDGAGVLVSDSYDFKGNPVLSTRQLLSEYKTQVDWLQNPQLETETFASRTLYDALNRPIQIVAPHSSKAGTKLNVTQPVYNEANLLERVEVWLEQDAEPDRLLDPNTATQHTVKNIDYNAKGQRTLIQYGNGAETHYRYDPDTFRLIHLYTRRGAAFTEDCGEVSPRFPSPEEPPEGVQCGLQNIYYTYDPVGNIITIRDDAQQTIFFNGQVVKPDADYKYDAIYRLIEAKGREHIGQASIPQTTWNDRGRVNLAHPNDGQAMRNYFEFYEYDEVGNIKRFDHKAHNGNWIRDYEYGEDSLIESGKKSNRLSQTVVHPNSPQRIPEPYTHDSHGNMTSMPHLSQMEWDFEDQLHHVKKGNVMAYYVYDAAGERVRKVVEKNNGTLIEERIYLGGFEVFRKCNGSGIVLERETLHIMDDQQRIAMVETRTVDTQDVDRAPRQLVRYQFGNHLGSASLELDDQAQIISYEEYYPYGSTSYQAVRSQTETPKRYRYTGKERDEESGLYYHGARYYAPWLGRWISCDPLKTVESVNLYVYVKTNPVRYRDPSGAEGVCGVWDEEMQECRAEPCLSEATSEPPPFSSEWDWEGAASEPVSLPIESTPAATPLPSNITPPPNIRVIRARRRASEVTPMHESPIEAAATRVPASEVDPSTALGPLVAQQGLEFTRVGATRMTYAISAAQMSRGILRSVEAGTMSTSKGAAAAVAGRRAIEATARGNLPAWSSETSAARNVRVHGNPLGPPNLEAARTAGRPPEAPRTNREVIRSAGRTSPRFNVAGTVLGILGVAATILRAWSWARSSREHGYIDIFPFRVATDPSRLPPGTPVQTFSGMTGRMMYGGRFVPDPI
jgi:RHS repeat-associated protein